MKLGPSVISRAPIGAQSAAAKSDIANALSVGQTAMNNAGKWSALGMAGVQQGMAADLNRGRAEIAKRASDVEALIEQNPDYIDRETLAEMGVEVDDNKVTEVDGVQRVRTYDVAGDLFDAQIDAGMQTVTSGFQMPGVTRRLNEEVDLRYKTQMRNSVQTWAVKKQREIGRTEYAEQMDQFRSSGQYDLAEDATETSRVGGLISDAEAAAQRDATSVSQEMRVTNNTILAAERGMEGLNALKQRIKDYDEKIAGEQDIVRGMDPDKAYAERQRMAAKVAQIEAANDVKVKVSITNDIAQLNDTAKGIPAGITSMSAGELKQYEDKLAWMEATGNGTDEQRIRMRNAIDSVKVTSAYAPQFATLRTGTDAQAQATYNQLLHTARQAGNTPGAFGEQGKGLALALYDQANAVMRERETALAQNPGRYAAEHNPAVAQSNQAMLAVYADPEATAPVRAQALNAHITAQTEAQASMGVPPHKIKGLDTKSPVARELQDTLERAHWTSVEPLLQGLSETMDPKNYTAVVNSMDDAGPILQATMAAYPENPMLAENISKGSRLENVPIPRTEFNNQARAIIGTTLSPVLTDTLLPSIQAAYTQLAAEGKAPVNPLDDPGPLEDLIADAVGEEVDMTGGFWGSTPFDSSGPTRGFREYGQPVAASEVFKRLTKAVTTPESVEKWGPITLSGEVYTITDVANRAEVRVVGSGKYQLFLPDMNDAMVPVYNDAGEPLILDVRQQ